MPRVTHVKKARKDYPSFGIKKGDSYYGWSFNFGPTMKSLTPPTRSQLTLSDFLSQLYDLEDGISNRFSDLDDTDEIQSAIDDLISDIQNLLDETQERLDSMPEQLQETSSAGETLQERIDNLENWISELESVDTDIDEEFKDEDKEGRITEIIDEIDQTSSGL